MARRRHNFTKQMWRSGREMCVNSLRRGICGLPQQTKESAYEEITKQISQVTCI